jgi:hypothetical protein
MNESSRFKCLYSHPSSYAVMQCWTTAESEAREFAARYRANGYEVDVWEYTADGCAKTEI